MVKNLSDSKKNYLSEEELYELGRISSGRNIAITRFLEQNLIFRCALVSLGLYAALFFFVSPFMYVSSIDQADIVAQSYRNLFRVRLLIVVMLGIGLVVSFIDGRVFKGFLLCVLIVLSNYSIDMYYFYHEHLAQSAHILKALYYTRPLLFLALITMYFNYNKS